jgi:hypothetical protein
VGGDLRVAVVYQRVFLRIVQGLPESGWARELQPLLNLPPTDPVARTIPDLARIWVARLEMRPIERALREHYGKALEFPKDWEAVAQLLPEAARTDPWGEPWVYRTGVPAGIESLRGHRYQLGPRRFPDLLPFAKAARPRSSPVEGWSFASRSLGSVNVLEIRQPGGLVTLQPGQRSGALALCHLAADWALVAVVDHLVAVRFSAAP